MNSRVFHKLKFLFEVFSSEPITGSLFFSNFWLFLHAVFCVAQLLVIIKYRNIILYTYDGIGKFSDYIKLLSSFFSYFTIIYVSWKHKSCYREIHCQLGNLKILLQKLRINIEDVDKTFKKTYQRKLLIFMAIQLLEISQETLFKSNERQSLRFVLAFTFSLIFCFLKHFHAIFYIDLINNYLVVLNEQLQYVSELILCNEERLKNKSYNKFLIKKIKICRNFYQILFRINGMQNKCMGQFFLVNHINFYIQILSSLYWVFFRLFNQEFDGFVCKYYL